jgi:predicted GNAT family acetyltransferase
MTEQDFAPEIVDDAERERFVAEVDGELARLEYEVEDGRLVLLHTEVPEPLGGRGLAGRLVQAAVARAARDGLTLAPWCPYARKWLQDHPDAAAAVVIDWSPPYARRSGGPSGQ